MSKRINPIGTTNDAEVKGITIKDYVKIGTVCMVCGEFVEIFGLERGPKICPECIKAIKFARRLMIANPRADKMLPCLEDDVK